MNKKLLSWIFLGSALLILAAGTYYRFSHRNEASFKTGSSKSKRTDSGFDKKAYSVDTPDSTWVVVNKKRPLPAGYTPASLRVPNAPLLLSAKSPEMLIRGDAASATEALIASAKQAGHELLVASGYRSHDLQATVYESFVRKDGRTAADATSARPGHSEHQTGLAVDVGTTDHKCEIEVCFGDTPAGKWVAAHAHEYGFIVRYQKGKQSIVGYEYEPWHLRYVGKNLAAELHKTGQTMEEFFGLGAAGDYPQ
jgi:LAS superfamily LD-carboxypeptidase LdcB